MDIIDTIRELDAAWVWIAIAALLAILEIAIAPGVFFIFIAIAAAVTGAGTLIFDLALPAQLLFFAAASVIAVYGGRQWYRSRNQPSSDPLLNDRAARMVGQTVTVLEPISAGGGRVRVGDSPWPAYGAALAVGAKARIIAVVDGKLEVEAME